MRISRILYIISVLCMLNNCLAADEVTLYGDADFAGNSKVFRGDTPWVGDDFNDITSSLKIPEGMWIILYDDVDYGGRAEVFTDDTSWVGSDFNDIVSSFRLTPGGEVTLYDDADFAGRSKVFRGNTPWVGDDFNDITSSLKIPEGKAIMVFEDVDYRGRARVFTSDASWVGSDFNDIVSSFKFIDLREGDIIYGFSVIPNHVGIVVNDDDGKLVVREAWPRDDANAYKGVSNIDISSFSGARESPHWLAKNGGFLEVAILRANVDDLTAHQAAENAKRMSGTYQGDFFEVKRTFQGIDYWSDDDDEWYCSKLVWKAYADEDVYLKPLTGGQIEVPVTPDEILLSDQVSKLYSYIP